eukprot:gnl/MRDRNA2_/MRDRNA2_244151_c0_seq1.p1 gnl/MRDRNA2_/MRDRNA2_244151_c0~~gnl/MRDRNA2_/MRDRNA2_244151_c0_seq1.p1  ORF type:complete len:106 (+),score=7.71 gnl/MRDRNA2_/MRDRNA2_244151_c0_seq1:33-320(+)
MPGTTNMSGFGGQGEAVSATPDKFPFNLDERKAVQQFKFPGAFYYNYCNFLSKVKILFYFLSYYLCAFFSFFLWCSQTSKPCTSTLALISDCAAL